MRKLQGVLAATLAMGLPVVLALAFIVLFRNAGMIQSVPGAVPPSATVCVPTPIPPTQPPWTPTATPDRAHFGTVPPPQPTMTPYPIKKTTDLSPNVPDHAKLHLLVFHCDGTYEMFLIAGNETDVPHQPGDVIIYGYLPDLMGHSAPAATAFNPQSPTPWPTPVPATLTAQAITQAALPTAQPYPAPAQTQSGYPAPVATQMVVGSPYPTPSDVLTVAPTPALPPLDDSPDQFDPKTYGLPDTIAGYKVLGVITSKNQACVPPGRNILALQSTDTTVQDSLKNFRQADVMKAMSDMGLNTTEWNISVGGPGSTREQMVAGIQAWNKDREKYGCVSTGGPAIPAATPTSQNP